MLLTAALAIALGGCPPPPPPPASHVLTSPRWIKNTLVTQYWPAPERWFTGRLVRVGGIPGRHHADWLFGARGLPMQGEGIASNGRVYHFAGPYDIGWVNRSGRRTAPCTAPGYWTDGRPFRLSAPARAHFAAGHSRTLVYWKSAAVDRRVIPFGSRIFMRALCSTPAHGWVVARDTGGAIGGAHIDIYRPPPSHLSGGGVLRGQAMLVVPPATRPTRTPRCPS
jgi:3D (Asp-Asp-Asp) domain-containing protein